MNLTQLLREAQFHGAYRLADRTHRCWWGLALFLGFLTATGVIVNSVYRYFQNPTYLTLLPEDVNQPFPSVQICPEVFFPPYKIEKFMSEINIPSGINATYMKIKLRQLAAFYSPDITYTIGDLVMMQSVLDHNMLDVDEVTKLLTTSCEETLLKCRWLGYMVNCSEIFQMQMTEFGYCCVFNGRSLQQEIKEYGMRKMDPKPHFILRQIGHTSGLMVAVNQSQEQVDLDLSYKWLTLDTGQDYVESSKNGTPLSYGQEVWAAFGYRKLKIADDARSLSPNLRRCRFYHERLKYFPVYKKDYCLVECEMERTLQQCQCLRSDHPRPPGVVRCRAKSLLCAKHAAVPFGTDQCDCPNTCDTDLDFFHTQSFDLLNKTFYFDRFYEDLDFKKVTVVRVFVMNQRARVSARRSLYGYVSLFSQLGGILNLYFGCSILTVLEIMQLLWRVIHKYYTSKAKVKINESKNTIIPPVKAKITGGKELILPPVEVTKTKGLILPLFKVKIRNNRVQTVARKRKFKRNKHIVEVNKQKKDM